MEEEGLPEGVKKFLVNTPEYGSIIWLLLVAKFRYESCPSSASWMISRGPIASRMCQHAKKAMAKVVIKGRTCAHTQKKKKAAVGQVEGERERSHTHCKNW